MKRRNSPEFVVATRGLVALDVEVRTGERDLHSGHYGGTALNAIHALAQALPALFPRDGRLPEPLRAGVAPPDDDESRAGASCRPARRSSHGSARCRSTTRAADEFYERVVRRAVARRDRHPRRQAGPAEHDGRLTRDGRDHHPGRSRARIPGARRRRPSGSSATRSPPVRRSRSLTSDLTPPAVLPRDTEVLALAREAFAGVFGRPPLIVRAGGTLPIFAALAARGIPTVMAGSRAARQPHALAERADAARDLPARRRGRARDLPRIRRRSLTRQSSGLLLPF